VRVWAEAKPGPVYFGVEVLWGDNPKEVLWGDNPKVHWSRPVVYGTSYKKVCVWVECTLLLQLCY